MVRLITLEREYGSGGAEFAQALANSLGWRLLDNCLVEQVAQEARVAPAIAAECDENLDPWYHRVGKAFWQGSTARDPESEVAEGSFDAERMVALQRRQMVRAAEEGHCIIVGRGAACALHTYPGAFHVFVFAGLKRKTSWYAQQFPARAHEAEQEVLAMDRRRAAFIRRHFDQDWGDRKLYHLMLDACMGHEAMLGAVLAGAGLLHQPA